jgi:hypothetical protein
VDAPYVDPQWAGLRLLPEDDGLALACVAADGLRGVGVPVWFGPDDMGASRFDRTFRRAAIAGLSGTLLVATSGVAVSDFIRRIEAPVQSG